MIWHNPSALPVPSNYVGVERIRLKQAVECLWWLSPDERPYADNKAILEPYSDRMLALIKNGGAKRSKKPSGHTTREGSFSVDNGGCLAPTIFQLPNSGELGRASCRERVCQYVSISVVAVSLKTK